MAKVSQRIKDRVRIADYSDLELMNVLADLGGDNDDVISDDISRRLFGGLVKDKKALRYANQCVGSRMSWMARFGFVERGEKPRHWILSNIGNQLRSSKLTTGFNKGITDLDEVRVLNLAQAVGDRIQTTGDVAFRAMERQLRFNILQRKRQ